MSYVKSLKRERRRLNEASDRIITRTVSQADDEVDDRGFTIVKSLHEERNKVDKMMRRFSTDMDFLMNPDSWDEV